MWNQEINLWNKGIKFIAGVDEVGRGPLAGPIVAAAVIWKVNTDFTSHEHFSLINDSKKLTEKRRLLLSDFIKKKALDYAVFEISPAEIDQNGVGEANKKALYEAVKMLRNCEHLLTDHFSISSESDPFDETCLDKGDQKSISIAAASIIAKVYRDNLMRGKYHQLYPQYGFDTHVGYGTKKHIEAIKKFGFCPIHRRSFKVNL